MTDNLKAIDIAKAIEGADWSGVSIGNKAILELAIKSLRSARNELTASAIDGAIAFGYQNTNPPPSDDHWLAPYWKIGRKQAELENGIPQYREAGVWEADGSKFKTYRAENLNGMRMYVREASE